MRWWQRTNNITRKINSNTASIQFDKHRKKCKRKLNACLFPFLNRQSATAEASVPLASSVNVVVVVRCCGECCTLPLFSIAHRVIRWSFLHGHLVLELHNFTWFKLYLVGPSSVPFPARHWWLEKCAAPETLSLEKLSGPSINYSSTPATYQQCTTSKQDSKQALTDVTTPPRPPFSGSLPVDS